MNHRYLVTCQHQRHTKVKPSSSVPANYMAREMSTARAGAGLATARLSSVLCVEKRQTARVAMT